MSAGGAFIGDDVRGEFSYVKRFPRPFFTAKVLQKGQNMNERLSEMAQMKLYM